MDRDSNGSKKRRLVFAMLAVAAVMPHANAQTLGTFGQRQTDPAGSAQSNRPMPNVGTLCSVAPDRSVQPSRPSQIVSPPTHVWMQQIEPSRPMPVQSDNSTMRMNGYGRSVGPSSNPSASTGWSQQREYDRPTAPDSGSTVRVNGWGQSIGPVNPPINQNNYAPYSGNPIRVTTPLGQREYDYRHRDNYIYDGGGDVTIINTGPSYLGGYYYSGYCADSAGQYVYPSIYSGYDGFPQYISNPGVIVLSAPVFPVYATPYLPFSEPSYQVTYNQNNYYVTQESKAADIEAGGDRAQAAIKNAYPANSYQAAFADIAHAWTDGNISLLRKHLRDSDTKISVLLKKKYSYSIASDDFVQITRDALDRLSTVSFEFTRLRKAKNGDVTAYGKHVYRTSGDTSGNDLKTDTTVPFDQNGPYDQSNDPTSGQEKTIYVSYTLRQHDDLWYITMIDSSPNALTPEQDQN